MKKVDLEAWVPIPDQEGHFEVAELISFDDLRKMEIVEIDGEKYIPGPSHIHKDGEAFEAKFTFIMQTICNGEIISQEERFIFVPAAIPHRVLIPLKEIKKALNDDKSVGLIIYTTEENLKTNTIKPSLQDFLTS